MSNGKTLDPIAAGVRKIINEKGIKQKVVASRAGFTERQFSDMLNDRKIIKACDLFRIAEALDVSVPDVYAAGQHSA